MVAEEPESPTNAPAPASPSNAPASPSNAPASPSNVPKPDPKPEKNAAKPESNVEKLPEINPAAKPETNAAKPEKEPPTPKKLSKLQESHAEWHGISHNIIGHTTDHIGQVKKNLGDMEQKEADRLAAEERERKRLAEEARREALRLKREAEARARAAWKARQQADMDARKAEGKQAKADEMQNLKDATARFKRLAREEYESTEKANLMGRINFALKRVGAAVFACTNSCSMMCGAMMVAEKRLVLRDERHTADKFVDNVHSALDKELKVLNSGRKEMTALAKTGKEIKEELEWVKVMMTTGRSRDNVNRRLKQVASSPELSMSNTTMSLPAILKKALK
jgi:hypothetical protein